jgi:rsbT co-antagonist protein RsbR
MEQAFFEQYPEIFVVLDPEGLIVEVNREAERASRCAQGESIFACLHPDDLGAFLAEWERLSPGGPPVRGVLRFRGADGFFQPFSWSARRMPQRDEVHAVLIPLPASAAEARPGARLHDAACILRALLDHLDVAVFNFDREGRYVYHDGKGAHAAGWRPGYLIGKNIFDIYPDQPDVAAQVRRALAGQLACWTSEAHDSLWEVCCVPVRDERGEVQGAIGIAFDKSDMKRATQDLRSKLAVIERQQEVIRNLETPILQVWDRVLALPMVGVVDSQRASRVMDDLLETIVRQSARFAILDLTGVDTVDAATASHLFGLVNAIKLLGAEGIITGIRPTVARTMVMLGLDLSSLTTCANLREALMLCIRKMSAEAMPRSPSSGQPLMRASTR